MIQAHFKPVNNAEISYSDNSGSIIVKVTQLSVNSELELRALLYRHISKFATQKPEQQENIFLFNNTKPSVYVPSCLMFN